MHDMALKLLQYFYLLMEKPFGCCFQVWSPYSLLIYIVSSPLKVRWRGEGVVFEIWTKRGVMKKLLRNRGLVERDEGVPNGFICFL